MENDERFSSYLRPMIAAVLSQRRLSNASSDKFADKC
jgi:hypothetical protein